MTLSEFLLARIAEDEAVARAALGPLAGETDCAALGDLSYEGWAFVQRQDPGRVLAECKAKRAIMAHHRRVDRSQPACYGCGASFIEEYAVPDVTDCPVLRALAEVYTDHRDYREEWRL